MEQRAKMIVVAVDGPSGTGKGTIALGLSKELGYYLLDSGALYRQTGLACIEAGVIPGHATEDEIVAVAKSIEMAFDKGRFYLGGRDVTTRIRQPDIDVAANFVAKIAGVREAMGPHQLMMAQPPGLVADGRDMWRVFEEFDPFTTHITVDYLVASRRRRAQQYSVMLKSGKQVDAEAFKLANIMSALQERDRLDRARLVSPLVVAPGAMMVDNTVYPPETAVRRIARAVRREDERGRWID